MTQPQWSHAVDAWTTRVACPAYGDIDVQIKTEGESDPPTEKQLAALRAIASLPKAVRKLVRKDVKRYASDNLDEEDLEDLEPEEFDVEFTAALIPRLRNSPASYFFLFGESEIDVEHGIACLCKNGEALRVCHSDEIYENYDWDATEMFEQMLRAD
jgi:hypothetical protein